MSHELSVTIAAPAPRIWSVLADVERWPEWTQSMTSVRFVQGDRLAVGSRVKIKQPRMPAVVWEVTELVPGQSFAWQARSPGMLSLATHTLAPDPAGGTSVKLAIRQSGPLGALLGMLLAGMTRRYVRMEADGLKRRSEAVP